MQPLDEANEVRFRRHEVYCSFSVGESGEMGRDSEARSTTNRKFLPNVWPEYQVEQPAYTQQVLRAGNADILLYVWTVASHDISKYNLLHDLYWGL